MKILEPLICHWPSGSFLAVDLRSPTAEPAEGSVRHMVPCHLPAAMLGMYFFFCSSVQQVSIRCMAARVSPGYMEKAMDPAIQYSVTGKPAISGRPCPPYSSDVASPIQPPSHKAS
jgi:hypothetical protein